MFRQEQRDSAHRVGLLNQKLADAERSLENSNHAKQTMTQQILVLQKSEAEWSKLEKEMREELVTLRKGGAVSIRSVSNTLVA